jgi:tetratricopeptide (TPR) repeat protein
MEGATDETVLNAIAVNYPDVAEELRVTSSIVSMSGPGADAELRSLESVSPLASVRRAHLLRPENPEAAAEILIDANERWHHPRLLLMAIDCYQQAGLLGDADRVAQETLAEQGPDWPGRVTVLRRLADIRSMQMDWSKVEQTCRTLLEIDQNDEDARWILAHAQYRRGNPQLAWETLNRGLASPQAASPSRAILLLDLARRYASAEVVARTAMEILNAYPDDREIHASVMQSVTFRVDRSDLPESLGLQITSAWESFFDKYPDNTNFIPYKVGSDDNPLVEIEDKVRKQAEGYKQVLDKVRTLGLPVGMLDLVIKKPYASIFPHRPLGYHRMGFTGESDIALEVSAAKTALTGRCVVDASALYTLAILPEVASVLSGLLAKPTVIDAAILDIVAADYMFALPSEGTLTYDSQTGKVIGLPPDDDAIATQRDQIASMLKHARNYRQIPHPELVVLASPKSGHVPVWMLLVDAAKHLNIPLWADDTGLRIFAHSVGVTTFGTQALIAIGREQGCISDETFRAIELDLLRQYVVDLPYEYDTLVQVAKEQEWRPESVATVLSRPAIWSAGEQSVALFLQAFRNAPDWALHAWSYLALSGVKDSVDVAQRAERLIGFLTVVLNTEWARPDHVSALSLALAELLPAEESHKIFSGALTQLWVHVGKTYQLHEAVLIFLHVISKLSDELRQFGANLVLAR